MKIFGYSTGPIMVNTYLVYDENNVGFIVDPGGPSKQMMDKIKKDNINIKYILLTHGHGDHIGGIEDIVSKIPQVKIVASEKEKELLGNGDLNSSTEIFGHPIEIEADVWVKDKESMSIGEIDVQFIETPGHTRGGICIYSGNILFSGDTLFHGSIGRTDFYGGNYEELINSIRNKLFILPDDTKVLPGHMGETSIGYEKKYNPFVR